MAVLERQGEAEERANKRAAAVTAMIFNMSPMRKAGAPWLTADDFLSKPLSMAEIDANRMSPEEFDAQMSGWASDINSNLPANQ